MTVAATPPRGATAAADTLVVAVCALIALRLGVTPLDDNSAFTHLATGIRMAADGWLPAIPRTDPYTFTAQGQEWVVQSWLPSLAVGWVHRVLGEHGITVLSGLTMAGLAWLVVSLARTGRPGRTAVAAFAALAVAVPYWSPRPLLVGLLCLALLIWVVERGASAWWLVPIAWVWVNSHGSFPLGLAWLVLFALGAALDGRRLPWQYAAWFVGGLAAAAVNPLGPKLLAFPLTALRKREVFTRVNEWGSPDFGQPEGVFALLGLVVVVFVLARAPRVWRDVLPVVVFIGLGLMAQRNLTALGVVLAPALARALRTEAPPVRLSADRFGVVSAGLAIAALVVTLTAVREPLVDASRYPVSAIVWLEQHDRFSAPHRVVTLDTVGNYLEFRRGARAEVFIDDRFDMFPLTVSRDYIAMRDDAARGVAALDRWRVDTVLWPARDAFARRLEASPEWAVAVRRAAWVVLIRRTD